MRGSILAILSAVLTGLPFCAAAQEPLYLRIRPSAGEMASAGGEVDAAQARAAREAVWERAERRARIAIASVCTGCLPAERPVSSPPSAAAAKPQDESPALAVASVQAGPLPPAETR